MKSPIHSFRNQSGPEACRQYKRRRERMKKKETSDDHYPVFCTLSWLVGSDWGSVRSEATQHLDERSWHRVGVERLHYEFGWESFGRLQVQDITSALLQLVAIKLSRRDGFLEFHHGLVNMHPACEENCVDRPTLYAWVSGYLEPTHSAIADQVLPNMAVSTKYPP